MDVHAGRKPNRNADFQHLSADGAADLFQKIAVPALCEYCFAGPRRHITVNSATFAGLCLHEAFKVLEPSPTPVFGQTVREARCAVLHNNARLVHIDPSRAVGHDNIRHSLFEQPRTGAPAGTHHIVVAAHRITAAGHKIYFVLCRHFLQQRLHFLRKSFTVRRIFLLRHNRADLLQDFFFFHRHTAAERFAKKERIRTIFQNKS